jgi:hypothetical protein
MIDMAGLNERLKGNLARIRQFPGEVGTQYEPSDRALEMIRKNIINSLDSIKQHSR